MSRWRIGHLSLAGRNRLHQAFYYGALMGALRYWLFSLVLPSKIQKFILSDAKQILWATAPDLRTDEDSTAAHSKPTIAGLAKYIPIHAGGGSLMHWETHVEAYYAQWGRRYLDPRDAPWKSVLDY